jgi:hypothetical protein
VGVGRGAWGLRVWGLGLEITVWLVRGLGHTMAGFWSFGVLWSGFGSRFEGWGLGLEILATKDAIETRSPEPENHADNRFPPKPRSPTPHPSPLNPLPSPLTAKPQPPTPNPPTPILHPPPPTLSPQPPTPGAPFQADVASDGETLPPAVC